MLTITVRNLSKSIDNNVILNDISFEITQHSINFIYGKNGVGKSTLLKIISGLLDQDSGEVVITPSCPQYSLSEMGYVFDSPYYIPNLSVKDYLDFLSSLKKSMKHVDGRIDELIEKFQLDGKKLIKNLSFGNKRKVELISALAFDPPFILLDEPFQGLDDQTSLFLVSTIKEMASNKGKGVLILVNDFNHFFYGVNKIYSLDLYGKIKIIEDLDLNKSESDLFLMDADKAKLHKLLNY